MLQELAVYIHWPFCLAKCPYCDFNSYVAKSVNQSEWLPSYINELRRWREMSGERRITSIFFGGGTPSLMDTYTVEALINEIDKLWGIGDGVEITLEANPTSSEASKFKGFKNAGVNRLSIGVQSLRPEPLKALGREHSVEEAIATLKTAAQIFDRYSFDLIYARQGQSVEEWKAELTEALQYARGHLSLYQLTIEEGTLFGKLYKRGEISIPHEDLAIVMYDVTQEIMAKHNMPAYEISNHAQSGQGSVHNLAYWNYGDYAGIGAGAHGRIMIDGNKYATFNHKNPEQWRKGEITVDKLSEEEVLVERLLMGLRLTDGIKWDNAFAKVINRDRMNSAIEGNLLQIDANNIRATTEGLRKLNSLLDYIIS